ncbi:MULTISPECIES: HRDC domain-containing protein [Streptomycetaceae]|uniref:Ribonuclease n=1 Tax=Streptantibioticus cattleyicolor (strain ATCC 35852 / DSM 46488 / JCM 4925 / NBRC 14057 / NRRL 8057) TaxID=1003195 RepID=G8WT25_STREN|nr:ribonuclease D [Streptantibioticus cattleyicolor]AEW97048.1 ribonuclease [Streptantibioticus cattleyicolor NRRL 8057 = DSM 46488]MYS61513.1 ribonuclease D [Streptomyces sp. SID5468]
MTDAPETAASEAIPAPVPLLDPRDGIPPVTADPQALADVVAAFAAGTGPVAVDAERASGYRYGQRAYLVQLRRAGAGTALIDPVACPDLSALGDALADTEWVLHAATQDLPCLDEIGMRPAKLFDTELAGRLAGFARVGLGAMVENVLGFALEKGHSAVDWSTRPLPEPWLRYAALDVELLVDLRDALEEELRAQGKLEWALQEFAAIAAAPPPAPRTDPWRRTSGMHKIRRRRQLGVVRELWNLRDRIARERDVSPGRVLTDAAIVAAALAMPPNAHALAALPGFGNRMSRRQLESWQKAVDHARGLPERELPQPGPAPSGPPPPRAWADKDPAAAARLAAARTAVTELAERLGLPQENLVSPDTVRRVCWEPPRPATAEAVALRLAERGARAWQIELVSEVVAKALTAAESGA